MAPDRTGVCMTHKPKAVVSRDVVATVPIPAAPLDERVEGPMSPPEVQTNH
jgi:hypothetical protein